MARRPNITVTVRDRLNTWKKISAELKKAKRRPHVKIGIQGRSALDKKTGKSESGAKFVPLGAATLVDIATMHEFGGDPGPPERSYLRATMDANKEKYIALTDKLRSEIVQGKMTLKKALTILGMTIVKDVKLYIRAGIAPALAQSTIDAKGSTTPLIDTGQLINAITYVVDMGDGDIGE